MALTASKIASDTTAMFRVPPFTPRAVSPAKMVQRTTTSALAAAGCTQGEEADDKLGRKPCGSALTSCHAKLGLPRADVGGDGPARDSGHHRKNRQNLVPSIELVLPSQVKNWLQSRTVVVASLAAHLSPGGRLPQDSSPRLSGVSTKHSEKTRHPPCHSVHRTCWRVRRVLHRRRTAGCFCSARHLESPSLRRFSNTLPALAQGAGSWRRLTSRRTPRGEIFVEE